jgi:hypothetical protein
MAKQTMKFVTSSAQTNSGILCKDIPGARCLKMVLTAIASEESSVKVIICAQKSTRLPEEYCGPERGADSSFIKGVVAPGAGQHKSCREAHGYPRSCRVARYINCLSVEYPAGCLVPPRWARSSPSRNRWRILLQRLSSPFRGFILVPGQLVAEIGLQHPGELISFFHVDLGRIHLAADV